MAITGSVGHSAVSPSNNCKASKSDKMVSEEPQVGGDAGASLLLNQPVVIDVGTSSLKAGFAGSSKPKVRDFIIFLLESMRKLTRCAFDHFRWSSVPKLAEQSICE